MTRRTTLSPYAACASRRAGRADRRRSGPRVTGLGRVHRQARLHRLGRRPSDARRAPRRPRSPWSRRCPRASVASSPSRCSPRSASTGSCRGPRPARSRSGRASGPPSPTPSGRPPPARPPSSRAGRGCRPSRRWRRRPTSSTCVAEADLAVVLHEDATAPLGVARRTGRRPDRRRRRSRGRHRPRGAGRPRRRAGAVAVRLGAEVLRTSTAGVVAVARAARAHRPLGLSAQSTTVIRRVSVWNRPSPDGSSVREITT